MTVVEETENTKRIKWGETWTTVNVLRKGKQHERKMRNKKIRKVFLKKERMQNQEKKPEEEND